MTTLSEHLARLGRKGGKATAQRRTKEERQQAARKAVQARWAKTKKLVDEITAGTKALEKRARPKTRAKGGS
jgi:hypothetical protein